ncbi:hypothetical protein KSB_15560 [Ktedonobacter robiniae]|uniref:Uncharacterized protein n=1 Tax=Ktedonobacter robiniae TaxID=2778365 RepID=A0ABQ3UK20_9CHLR|nr:hypothetical protein KSB_15560 [Ktedonobacter robiniae]
MKPASSSYTLTLENCFRSMSDLVCVGRDGEAVSSNTYHFYCLALGVACGEAGTVGEG